MEFIEENWGNLASVVGLLLSIAVLVLSTKAKQAADAAVAAINRKTIVEEVRAISDEMSVLSLVSNANTWELGEHISRRVARNMTFFVNRWDDQLPVPSKGVLNKVIVQVETVNRQFTKFLRVTPSDQELEALSRVILKVTGQVVAEVGRLESQYDKLQTG